MGIGDEQDLNLLHAVEAMPPDQREHFLNHLATSDPEALRILRIQESALAGMALTLAPVAPPAHLRDQLLERAVAQQSSPMKITPIARPKSSWMRYAVAASIGLLVGGITWHTLTTVPSRQQTRDAQNLADARLSTIGRLQHMMSSGKVSLIAVKGQEASPNAGGRIFWDKESGKWNVYVFNLSPPAPGREYELWFINDKQQKIPGGTFAIDATGQGQMQAVVPTDAGKIMLAAITDEPLGGTLQPTGKIHLVGTVE